MELISKANQGFRGPEVQKAIAHIALVPARWSSVANNALAGSGSQITEISVTTKM